MWGEKIWKLCVCVCVCPSPSLPLFGGREREFCGECEGGTGVIGDRMALKEDLVPSFHMGFTERVLCSQSPGFLEFLHSTLGLV